MSTRPSAGEGGIRTRFLLKGATQGKQTLTGTLWGNGTTLILSPKMAYVKGDAAFLESVFDLAAVQANKHVGQWISIPSYSSFYASTVAGLTILHQCCNGGCRLHRLA